MDKHTSEVIGCPECYGKGSKNRIEKVGNDFKLIKQQCPLCEGMKKVVKEIILKPYKE